MRLQRILFCAQAASIRYFLMETIVISMRSAAGIGEITSDVRHGTHGTDGAFAEVSAVGGIVLSLAPGVPVSVFVATISFVIYLFCWLLGRRREMTSA